MGLSGEEELEAVKGRERGWGGVVRGWGRATFLIGYISIAIKHKTYIKHNYKTEFNLCISLLLMKGIWKNTSDKTNVFKQ